MHTLYKAQYSKFTCAYINSRIKDSIYTNGFTVSTYAISVKDQQF